MRRKFLLGWILRLVVGSFFCITLICLWLDDGWREQKKRERERRKEKKNGWQAFCYAMRSNTVQLLTSGVVGTFTNFQSYILIPPPPQHLTVFVCFLTAAYFFSETPLTFLKLHGSMSQMVSIDQHFIPFGSENER